MAENAFAVCGERRLISRPLEGSHSETRSGATAERLGLGRGYNLFGQAV